MKITIKRSEWARGRGPQPAVATELSNGLGKCCLGFAALAYGATEEQIENRAYPYETEWSGFKRWPSWLVHRGEDTPECRALTRVNDSDSLDEATREEHIAVVFAEHGDEVEFMP